MDTGMIRALTDEVTRAWDQYGDTAVLGAGVALALLMAFSVWRFARSGRKDRWVDRIAAVLVLAWTSEGMWEVATQRLGFPVPFAVATFFVVEAMMLSSGMRASQHRESTGVPGPSGTLVWVLAGVFGFIVALNAGSVVEFVLRATLPLAAVSLWWTGLTAERPDDTDEMRWARRRRAEEREATWTVTPRTLLVRWGLMKPGNITTTEAQREHQIRRMVVYADRAASETGRVRMRAIKRLRGLTRTADAEMVDEVAVRVDRARRAEDLMVSGVRFQRPPQILTMPISPVVNGRYNGHGATATNGAAPPPQSDRHDRHDDSATKSDTTEPNVAPQRPTRTSSSRRRRRSRPGGQQSDRAPRRSIEEWVDLAAPIYRTMLDDLRRQPTALEFAVAIKDAGHGPVSESQAKKIRAGILDRSPLPDLGEVTT